MTNRNTTPRPTRRRFSGPSVMYYFAGLFVLTIVGFWGTFLFGGVSGVEFSPETLQRREFSFRQLPLLGIQVSPIQRTVTTTPFEQYLVSSNLVTPVKPERWDLVRGYEGTTTVDPRGASILCSLLDMADHNHRPYWMAWCQTHPKLAAILWPEVIAVARMRHYEIIPDMMRVAQSADEKDPQQFQSQLDALVITQAMQVAQWWQQLDTSKARDLYQLVLSKDPQHQGARRALEKMGTARAAGTTRTADVAGTTGTAKVKGQQRQQGQ